MTPRNVLRKIAEKSDSAYAHETTAFFQVDYDRVLRSRRLGRATALEHLAYGVTFIGETEAESYRIVSCHDLDFDTAKVMEMVFLVAYTHEYYSNIEEIVSDDR